MIEHALLIFKVVLETVLTEPPKEAVDAYQRRCFLRDKILLECEYLEAEGGDDGAFYTDDDNGF
jgi:hypothetical protein